MAKSAEGIRQRKYKGRPIEGSYEINFRPFRGGNRVQRIIHAGSIAEAKVKRAEMIAEILKAPKAETDKRSSLTFDLIWPEIERYMLGRQREAGGVNTLKAVYNRMFIDYRLKYHPQIKSPDQITLAFLIGYEAYYVLDLNRPQGPHSEIRKFKEVMAKMKLLGFCPDSVYNILLSIKTPKRNKKVFPVITDTEIKELLTRLKSERPDIWFPSYFMARTGRRIEETTLIEREDVILDGYNPIKINVRAETTKMKEKAPLEYLDSALQNHIRVAYQLNNKQSLPYLFLNAQGRKCSQQTITAYLKELSGEMFGKDRRITAHYFRHRFCTEAGKKNLPIIDVLSITGIKNVKTLTNYYSHSTTEGLASVLEKTRL